MSLEDYLKQNIKPEIFKKHQNLKIHQIIKLLKFIHHLININLQKYL
jgi:dynactin complex subunit